MIEIVNDEIRIAGIATAVPTATRKTDEFKPLFGEEAVEKYKAMVGVREVRIADKKQTSSDLAFCAAKQLLNQTGTNSNEIGILVFVSQTPDYRLPATACVLAHRLGASKDCIVFDVNLGCSGYVYGLAIVNALMQTSNVEKALLLVGDTLSKYVSTQDKSSCMLFGDSGAATLLEKKIGDPSIHSTYRSDGSGYKAIIIPSGASRNLEGEKQRTVWPVDGNKRSDYELFMNGTDVFSFTISEVPKLIQSHMSRMNATIDDYDAFILHQANCFILKQIAKKAKLPLEKMPISMDRYGNTSVTSIPLTLCDSFGNEFQKNQIRTLLCGFGVGLSWGVIDVKIDSSVILPIIESDECYYEGGVSHD